MAEELQGLLDRIHREGVKKAEAEKDEILSKARDEAKKIVDEARAESAELRRKAGEDAASSEAKAKSAIQQAARDVVLSLRSELESRLSSVVKSSVGQAMTPDFMGRVVAEMAKSGKSASGIEVLVNKNDLEQMAKLFAGSLSKDLREKPDLSLAHDFGHGFKIGFKGEDVFLDFSDDAITEMICQYIGPKLARLVSGK